MWAPWSTTYTGWAAGRGDQDEVMWSATVDGEVVGMAALEMPRFDNQHIAVSTLFVHPDHRRRGIGTALLTGRRRPRPRRRTHGADGRAVLPRRRARRGRGVLDQARGFELGIAEMSRVCDLVRVRARAGRPSRPRPRPTTPTTASRPGRTGSPGRSSRGTARWARRSTSQAPLGELDLEDEVWSPERVAERDERFVATGRRQFGVLAYAADGTCVGTTELFVNAVASWRALQGGTLVIPGHRGHRLGLSLKLANLQRGA